MNLYLRLLAAFVRASYLKQVPTNFESRCAFRVLPGDIDLYRHMNNGRYFQIMDVARFSWLIQVGAVAVLRRQRWGALLGGGQMRFRRALKLFQKYFVSTRLICWDDRWFYLEHRFTDARGREVACGVVKAAFRSRSGWVRTSEAMALIDPEAKSESMPDCIGAWIRSEEGVANMQLPRCAEPEAATVAANETGAVRLTG